MRKPTDQLLRIAACGGGMILDGRRYNSDSLMKIATNASQSGAVIIIKNITGYTSDNLMKIASCGKGNVIFDFYQND